MSFYEKMYDLETTEENFRYMMKELFSSKHKPYKYIEDALFASNTNHLKHLPRFFKYFITEPDAFEKFLDKVADFVEAIPNVNVPVAFEHTNFFTLVTFGLYHLVTMYVTIEGFSHDSAEFAVRFYIKPYSEWMTYLFENIDMEEVNLNQKVSGFLAPFQYMLLISYVLAEADRIYDEDGDFQNTGPNDDEDPLCNFINGISQFDDPVVFDLIDDIFATFMKENKDVYEQHVGSIKKKDGRYLYDSTERLYDVETYYRYSHLLRTKMHFKDKSKKECREFIIKYLNHENFKATLYFMDSVFRTPVMYDKDEYSMIVNDKKWQAFLGKIFEFLHYSPHLKYDFHYLLEHVDMSENNEDILVYKKNNVSIAYTIANNAYFDKNSKYIAEFLMTAFNQDDINIPLTKNHLTMCSKVYDNDVLMLLIERFMIPSRNNSQKLPRMSFNSPIFENKYDGSVKSFQSLSSNNSRSSTSPMQLASISDTSPRSMSISNSNGSNGSNGSNNMSDASSSPRLANIKMFKPIIWDLLKYKVKITNEYLHRNMQIDKSNGTKTDYTNTLAYYNKIYKYYDDLKRFGIDLNKLHINQIILDSPVDKSRRSVNKSVDINVEHDHLLYGLMPSDQQKTLQKLVRIYTRSVQSDKESSYDRIVKIRNYLISKYKKEIDYDGDLNHPDIHKVTVRKTHEYEDFYNYWVQTLNKGDLNQAYMIRYENEQGQDYNAITRQVLTAISLQIKKEFVLLEDTNRYVLRGNIQNDVTNFIGQFLGLIVLHNIHIPFNLSIMYLGHMMFRRGEISAEEKYLYYLLDLSTTDRRVHLEVCKSDHTEERCSVKYIVGEKIPLVYIHPEVVPNGFINGFFIDKKIFGSVFRNIHDKIRIYDLDKLLSQMKINTGELKHYVFNIDRSDVFLKTVLEFVDENGDKMELEEMDRKAELYRMFKQLMVYDSAEEYKKMYAGCSDEVLHRIIVQVNDPIILERKKHFETRRAFRQAVMMFWSGSQGVLTGEKYQITIIATGTEKPTSSSCFNHLKLPADLINDKQTLYNMFMKLFVLDQHKVFDLA